MKIFIGLLIFLASLAFTIYYKKINEAINLPIGWAERYLGSTAYAYFIFGMIGIILGLSIVFNVLDLGWLGL